MFQQLTIGGPGPSKALVFAHFAEEKPDEGTRRLAKRLGALGALDAAAARPDATGDAGSVLDQPGPGARVLLLGLGKRASFEVGVLRSAAAGVAKRLAASKIDSASIEIVPALHGVKANVPAAGQCFGEGLGLIAWVCDEFRGTGTPDPKRIRVTVRAGDKRFEDGMRRGRALADATNLARTLSQTPPNVATPAYMAQQAEKLAKAFKLGFKVFKGDDLKKEKMVGHIAVGAASENKPCVVRLEYAPPGTAKEKPVVLIGKTMCYDTGGLSLKVNNGMVGMKRDKDGGCAVLGAMRAIAETIKPKRRVVAFLAAAENSVSDEAYRPDDVLRYRNGVTVEVTNTDAEGRLVLADALCYACDKEDPACVIDLATLTGGVVVALGSTYCGMFCEDDRLRAKIEAAAAASGERVWRLPMHAEYRDMMKSPVADILNSNPNRKAHPIQGAAFLSYFVGEKIPWCHLDIAGVHVCEKPSGPFIDGPTGWGVRLLANLVAKA